MSTKAKSIVNLSLSKMGLSKTDIYRLRDEFNRVLIKSFNEHFKLILNDLSKSHTSELTNHIKNNKKKIQESIFSKNLNRNILLILLKNNCVCYYKKDYCFCCGKDAKIHPVPTEIITPSNFKETISAHGSRNKPEKVQVKIEYQSKNTSNYKIGKKLGEIHHKSIFLLPIKLSENSLFNKEVLDELSGNSNKKGLMAGVLEKGNTRMQEVIKESVRREMIFFARISSLYHMLNSLQVVYSKTYDKSIISETEELECIDEGLKFIETTTGAGIFYLRNTQFTGYISLAAVKKYMRNRNTYKFTEDHIYRRKLAAKYLLNNKLKKVKNLYDIYTEKFSFISLLDSSENSSISKVDVNENGISSNMTTEKYLKLYTKKLAEKPFEIEMIKTNIKSKHLLEGCIIYLMDENQLNSESEDHEIKDKLGDYMKIFDFWIN